MDYAIDESTAQAGLAAFDQALEIAENEQIRCRTEKASICAYRAAIEPIWYVEDPVPERPAGPREWYGHLAPQDVDPELVERMRPLVQRFIELCDKYEVTATHEEKAYSYPAARLRLMNAVGL